jgi:hypothetical protein
VLEPVPAESVEVETVESTVVEEAPATVETTTDAVSPQPVQPLVVPNCSTADYIATWLPEAPRPVTGSEVIAAFMAALKKHADSQS